MEVARDKLVAPTLFDVVAPRSMPEPSGGKSFRDCFTLTSPHDPTSRSAQGNSPADNAASRDMSPAAAPQPTQRKSEDRPQNVKADASDDVSGEDKVADATSDAQEATPETSEVIVDDEPVSEEKEASDEEATSVAELLAAANIIATSNQPVPDHAGAEEKPVEAELAVDNVEAVPQSEKKPESTEAVDLHGVIVQPAEAKAAEQVAMPAVAPVQPGEEAEQAVKPETAEATLGVVESVELTDSDVTRELPLEEFPTVTPDAVQPTVSQGSGEQADRDRRRENGDAKKTAAKASEAVSAPQHSGNQPVPVTDTREIDTAVNESTDEEIAADSIEARRNNPIAASAPATPAEQATTPVVTPSQDVAATTANTNDASVESAATPTVDANVNAASSAQASTPRVPPALLRKAESHGQPHVRPGEIDPARFLNRVVKAFESAQQRDSEVRLRLHPAELGSLSIEVKVQDSVLTARLQAETPEARTALLDNLPMLRERLAEQGIRIEKFDVDLMDHSDRQPQQSPSEQMPEDSGRRASQARTPTPTAKVIEKETKATSVRGGNASDRLNVVI